MEMAVSVPGQMFSVPENDQRIMNSWERFLNGDGSAPNALRRMIDDSWRRCQSASVDPRRNQAPPPMREDTFYSLRDEFSDLMQASAPVMASARDFLSETGTVMVLTNPAGTILNLEGDISLRSASENIRLLPGASWSEMACGTNAIGTALAIGQPVQIHSAEHYCSGIKRWSCSANVIRDPHDGSILGAVDVSGLSETYNRHSLALVVAAAGRIENRLARMEMDIRYRLLEHCMDRLSSGSTDGVIVFDRHGWALKANGLASAFLQDMNARGTGMTTDGLASLALGWKRGRDLPDRLPEWMRRDWLEPIVVDGERLGVVLVLPDRRGAAGNGGKKPMASALPVERQSKAVFDSLIGEAPALLQAGGRARQLAKTRVPVLLLGETGVGKDVFAHRLHADSDVRGGPFVALNCGSFSRELLSSELFGYAEGAFTGARRGGMIGKIEAADGGTLFLDEIGEMPLDLQPHFLRVLESGEVYRIGETKPRKVNFRLVAATNRDLRKEIQGGRFRMDLFYRVAVTSITIPPLRERADDIPMLADHFLRLLSERHGMETPSLSPGLLASMRRYNWPGNIRELRNAMESMLLMSRGGVLTEADSPAEIGAADTHAPHGPADLDDASSDGESGLTRMKSVERNAILRVIREAKGNLTAVARELGIAKSTLYVKLKRFGLENVVDDLRGFQN